MGASRNILLLVAFQLMYIVSTQELTKRVPQGFVGMRGKKFIESDDIDRFYKRKPQFFVGVKGKKNLIDSLEDELYYKRAPMGFMGMRGKKEAMSYVSPLDKSEYSPKLAGSMIGQIDYSAERDDNSIEDSLMGEMARRYLFNNWKSIESELNNDSQPETVGFDIKRGATSGTFIGTRGKKSLQNKRPYDLSFRGKFIGVRGKKDVRTSGEQGYKFLLDETGSLNKRKTQMGFFGMRGKKWFDGSSPEVVLPN